MTFAFTVTCGLNHIEAIAAIIDDNIESTAIPLRANMADSMGEWHDDNFGLVMVGRFPERLPLDLGIEVLAREMGGHDIVIDTVLRQAYLWYTCRRHIWRPHYQH